MCEIPFNHFFDDMEKERFFKRIRKQLGDKKLHYLVCIS